MATDETVASEQLWHLEADIPPQGVDSPVVFIRWIYDDPEALKKRLEEEFLGSYVPAQRRVLKPYMLLVVRRQKADNDGEYDYYEHREVKRYVVPLADGAAWVGFNHSGLNEVIGLIVNIPDSKAADEADKLVYQRSDVFYRGRFRPNYEISHIGLPATVTVPVDEALFPPEPPVWAKKFVGCFFKSRSFDQCQFWRRFAWGIPLTLLALSFGMVARTLTLITALVIGLRDIPWRGLNPFNGLYDWPWPEAPRRSFYFQTEDGRWRVFTPAILLVHPITIAIAATVVYFVYGMKHGGLLPTLVITAVGVLILAFGVTLLILVVCGIAAVVGAIGRAFHKQPDYAEQVRLERQRREAQLQAGVARLDQLITNAPRTLSLRLRTGAFKRTHCRPYARD